MAKKKKDDLLDHLTVNADIQNGDKKIKVKANIIAIVILIASVVGGIIVLGEFGIIDAVGGFIASKAAALIK